MTADEDKATVASAEDRAEARAILKNVVVVSIAFMVLFTAFQSMASLQSSINKVDGLGTYSLSVIYASLIVSSMFVPSYLIKRLSTKWTMVAAMMCYATYIAAQFYPQFYTLIPAAVVIGVAKCAYLSQIGCRYAEVTCSSLEVVIVRFFGIFFMFFQSSAIWGNTISSVVLGHGRASENASVVTAEQLSRCGTAYCPAPSTSASASNATGTSEEDNENFRTDITQIYSLAGIYLACAIVSPIIIAVFVDPVSKFREPEEQKTSTGACDLLLATLRHLRLPKQWLIVPLTLWSGLEQGFFGADFTAGYVSCAYGVHNVGFVLITYGVCDAAFSLGFGALVKVTGRVPVFAAGAVINAAVLAVLFTWQPHPDSGYVFYILSGLWGTADAVWQTQINALHGTLFRGAEEAAFSNYRLWESLGFLVAYILQTQVCVLTKLWVLVFFLSTGMAGYAVIEVLEARKARSNSS